MSLWERAKKVLPPVAARSTQLGIVEGHGSYLYGEDGRKYLDFASGVAVCNVGHNHPEVVQAIREQLGKLVHGGHNVVYYEPYVALAEEIVSMTGGDTMVYFSNSGAEANEGALKLAKYVTGRPALVAFSGAFHGRTLGAASITTSNASFRKKYEPLLPSIYFAEYPYCYRCPFGRKQENCSMECLGQFDCLFSRAVDPSQIAAMIIEPVAGEGGYIVPPAPFMQGLYEICREQGILLIFDEIQTGFGRTGKMFAYEHLKYRPDIMTCAKGIANGLPLSAIIARRDLMEQWPAGAHGGTFGGNPLACAAAKKVVEILRGGGLDNAKKMGSYLLAKLNAFKSRYKSIGDVRGTGLMLGVEFIDGEGGPNGNLVHAILDYCIGHGLILLSCGPHKHVIRFICATTVTKQEIDDGLAILEAALQTAEA
ncbi:MAG: aspartate aminotransferase family protein [Acidaminococcales bacterium]|nr:aspartate aminotransferase family protein [Acidaminococcales bacterium]